MTQNQLFNLNHDELYITQQLSRIIKEQVNKRPISFSQYMNYALYYPQLGYYSNSLNKFGPNGDYITAPVLSKLFSMTLLVQMEQVLSNCLPRNILEFGAGNGQLMLDILSFNDHNIDSYYILEPSIELATLQRNRLRRYLPQFSNKVRWLRAVPTDFNGVVIANEVLDAMPCDLISYNAGRFYLKMVTSDDDGFVFEDVLLKDSSDFPKLYGLPSNCTFESNLAQTNFMQQVAKINSGLILFIDYGYGSSEYYKKCGVNGTIRSFFRHHLIENVLLYPGLVDITSSVNFTHIAQYGLEYQLELLGYTNQSNFLINCGILDQLTLLQQNMTYEEQLGLNSSLNYLTSPNEMGDVFKVIALAKNLDVSDLIGFTSGDKTYTL